MIAATLHSKTLLNTPTLNSKSLAISSGFERAFFCYTFSVLGMTGVAKLASCFGTDPILFSQDPVLHVGNFHLLLITGMWEVAVASLLWLNIGSFRKAYLIWFTATGMLMYRVGQVGTLAPCPCLGSLHNAVPLSRAAVELLLTVVAATLFLGSGLTMLSTFLIPRCRTP
jgi:hypothetical protein